MANMRLKCARLQAGLTQLQLAEKVGAKERHVSLWETDRSTPDPETKQRVAAALQRPSFELFDR
jgi:transcriptional regulator with XRE-family HTH domain